MKTPIKSVLWLVPFMLTACVHKTQQAQTQPLAPPIVDTPLPAPQTSPTDLPPPVVTTPAAQQPPADTTPPAAPPEKPAKKPVHHSKNPEVASSGPAPNVSAIGQLSPGDPSDLRGQTEQLISTTEQGLKAINRPLSDQQQKTVSQIKDFLKQARTALTSGDVDGANTLALKAKVLLGEIKS
jgi:hypothetical protein